MTVSADKMRVFNYATAKNRASRARNMSNGAPMGVRTRIVVSDTSRAKHGEDGCIYAMEYCYSELVKYHPNGLLEINCNGWDSKTTKERIREFSDIYVHLHRGQLSMIPFGWGRVELPINGCVSYFVDKEASLVYGPEGEVYDKSIRRVGAFKPLPKSHRPERTMFVRDVLVDPEGNDWMVVDASRVSEVEGKALVRYYGDDPNDRSYAHLGEELRQVNDLFLLSMGDGWTAKERYVRVFEKRPIQRAA